MSQIEDRNFTNHPINCKSSGFSPLQHIITIAHNCNTQKMKKSRRMIVLLNSALNNLYIFSVI